MRHAGVVDLPDVAVLHDVAVAAAVDLHRVPETRGVVASVDALGLDGAADPAELAVPHGQVAAGAGGDAVDAHVLDGEVLDRHARRAAHAEPARLHVEFD